MNILEKLKQNIVIEVNKIFSEHEISSTDIVFPPKNEQGDLCLPSFELAKKNKKNPIQIADSLENKLEKIEGIKEFKAQGPYLNFILDKDYIVSETLSAIFKEKNKYGQNQEFKGKKIMIEFAHPNPFKAFHIGHLRNIILGESLVRIFEFSSAQVIRTNYQGDVGMHIAKCIWAFRKIDEKDYPENINERVSLLADCYSKGAGAFESDAIAKSEIEIINKEIYEQEDKDIKKLWELGKKWSLDKFAQIYKRLDTRFDRQYMESEIKNEAIYYIEEALKKKILIRSEGAVIFPGDKYGLETRVFLNSQGLPTYDGKELGLAYREFTDFGKIDLCIHNVAVEQISFFKVNFKVQELLDPQRFKDKQKHNAYEFVGLKKGKMSSRLGKVVLAETIIDLAKDKIKEIICDRKNNDENNFSIKDNTEEVSEKLAISSIKYAFLKINPFKYFAFDVEESVSFSGNSGPYINYTYARINSILKKGKPGKLSKNIYKYLNYDEEKDLIVHLSKFPQIIIDSRREYNPSELVKYLFELSKKFNDYYHKVPIIKANDKEKKARLKLLQALSQVLENGAYLLGFELVQDM
ncbi:MAG TPA: arginine--tRNA ligase [Patescibacteria group bacterium]|nr:arginine--tRNA ligase [Patescibacteria group bacterium]